MSYVWLRDLADDLRDAGLKVVEVEGWKNRGRPASTGHMNPNGTSTTHHTGTKSSKERPAPGLATLINGRSDLPGPLCHVATAYDGTVYVIAAGRANHAGRVGKKGVVGMPFRADGNALAIGNEVITDGKQAIPAAQAEAIAGVAAVVSKKYGRDHTYAHRHADISGTGKWDLGQWTTAALRKRVKAYLDKITVKVFPSVKPKRLPLAKGVATRTLRLSANNGWVNTKDVRVDKLTHQQFAALLKKDGSEIKYLAGMIKELKAAGITKVEITVPNTPNAYGPNGTANFKRLKKKIEEAGIELVAVKVISSSPTQLQAAQRLAAARQAGIKTLVVAKGTKRTLKKARWYTTADYSRGVLLWT